MRSRRSGSVIFAARLIAAAAPTSVAAIAAAFPGVLTAAWPAPAQSETAKPAYVPIMRVQRAEVRRTNDPNAPYVLIAWGQISTDGWRSARLKPYTVPGEPNSVWRFRFEAIPPQPGRPVTQAIVNVVARLPLTGIGPHVHTFSIHARANSIWITPIPKPAPK